jgi:transcription antitermination factor NusG
MKAQPQGGDAAWYCLRSKTKQEHVAAGSLRQMPDVEVFAPRLRFRRKTRRGPVWFVEALFPGYLFARFNWAAQVKMVQYARGILGVVHFGLAPAIVPASVVDALRRTMDGSELRVVAPALAVGDEVQVTTGPLAGLQVVVQQVMPARERVKVLLEFLGRRVEAEVAVTDLTTAWQHPLQAG